MFNLSEKFSETFTYPLSENQRQKVPDQWCYLICCPQTKMCKIGISARLRDRMLHIQSGIGMNIKLLIAIEPEVGYDESAAKIEEFLHRYFRNKKCNGEWFNLTIKDILEIRQLFWHIYGDDIIDEIKEVLNGGENIRCSAVKKINRL